MLQLQQHKHGNILDLPDEVLGEILSHCALEDVLRVQQSCKRMQTVAQRREVWLSQLQALDIDCAAWVPTFLPLASLDAPQMKDNVVAAFQMCQAWRHQGRLRIVKETEIKFQQDEHRPRLVSSEVKVAPGGQEVLLCRDGWFELWSLDGHELLWTATPPEGNVIGSSADLDIVQDGQVLMIVCEFSSAAEPMGNSIIRVYRYDKQTAQGEVMAEIQFPPTYCHDLEIKGDFVMTMIAASNQRALYNWKTGHGISLSFICDIGPLNFPLQYATVTSSHIVGVVKQGDGLFAFATSFEAFDGLWTHSSQYDDWAHHVQDPRLEDFISLDHPNLPFLGDGYLGTWILNIHSFRPIWKTDGPLELFILGYCLTGTKMKRLISYRLQLSTLTDSSGGTQVPSPVTMRDDGQLKLVEAGCALTPVLPWDKSCMFNSGHIICLREQLRCFALFRNTDQPLFDIEIEDHPWRHDGNGPFATAVDPWSGRIVVVSNRQLMTYRFEPVIEYISDSRSRNKIVT